MQPTQLSPSAFLTWALLIWSTVAEPSFVPYKDGMQALSGYNSFLGKTKRARAVAVKQESKRDLPANGQGNDNDSNSTFPFIPPTASSIKIQSLHDQLNTIRRLARIQVKSKGNGTNHHLKFRRETDKDQPRKKRTRQKFKCPRGLSGDVSEEIEQHDSFRDYFNSLGVSASSVISGWGGGADLSGEMLDAAGFSTSTTTYIVKMKVTKQVTSNRDYELNSKQGNLNYSRFHMTHGDKWIKDFQSGGQLIIRIFFTANRKETEKGIAASAGAAAQYLGFSGKLDASAKSKLDEIGRNSTVKMTISYQGDLGVKLQEEEEDDKSLTSGPGQNVLVGNFERARERMRAFVDGACEHNFRFRAILDDWESLDLPPEIRIPDYATAKIKAVRILEDVVTISQLAAWIESTNIATASIKRDIQKREDKMIIEARKWINAMAANPDNAEESGDELREYFKANFFDKILDVLAAAEESVSLTGLQIWASVPKKATKAVESLGYQRQSPKEEKWVLWANLYLFSHHRNETDRKKQIMKLKEDKPELYAWVTSDEGPTLEEIKRRQPET
ncbi:Proteinase inhibitor, propeptide [Ophiocordyceps camponoti-floridani]|uniref:Proteinase inhibitor, propeptide n=1 Tax=Ophiocordyceps camponoti-floridani TaxID=2030778 RepID=A0A8H4VD68_9HYPO|nr:Proteinase inhibitor, propeptide [Ophiocordyceps camponoti-floridani]